MARVLWALRFWRVIYAVAAVMFFVKPYRHTGNWNVAEIAQHERAFVMILIAFGLQVIGFRGVQRSVIAGFRRSDVSIRDIAGFFWMLLIISPVVVELVWLAIYGLRSDDAGRHVLFLGTIIGLVAWQLMRWEAIARRLIGQLEAGQ